MFFTRTIRRKLFLGLGLMLCIVLTLGISGVTGLHSYRDVVGTLDHILNEAPHKAQLCATVTELFEPLRQDPATRTTAPRRMTTAELDRLMLQFRETQKQVWNFRHRMEDLPLHELPADRRAIVEQFLNQVDLKLRTLERAAEGPQDAELRARLIEIVADIQMTAQKVPDPGEALGLTLRQARTESRSKVIIIYAATAIVVVLLVVLTRFGYVAVFDPIRKLHQGALRVAHGDFDFRLKATTGDEMAELADAFNEMTTRFQAIAGDLEGQVRERSQQLVRSERLANVGFLSSCVAHEINNPLNAISMAAESTAGRITPLLCHLEASEAAVIQQYLQMIQDEAERCRVITSRLLDFARARDSGREPTDLKRVVQEVIAMVQHLSKYRGKHVQFESSGTCQAEVNGGEIKQVVLNLVANGLEAVERGGTLRIRITEQPDDVRMQFEDDGCGMTPDVIEKIFEPFFTQKQNGQGTGLGLSISHRIVMQHGGTIMVSSAGPGRGSTFCVRLPRRSAQRGAA